MSGYVYSTVTIRDITLIERIKKAYFHFKGSRIETETNYFDLEEEEYTKTLEGDFIDLAVLLGIRENCYETEGDTPLTRDELKKLTSYLNIGGDFVDRDDEDFYTKSYYVNNAIRSFDHWYDRLLCEQISFHEDGSVAIYLNSHFRSLWIALTIIYPGTSVEVIEEWDNGDDDHYGWTADTYYVQYGWFNLIDSINYDDYKTDEEKKELSSGYKEEEINDHDLALMCVRNGYIEKSIEIWKKTEDSPSSKNNIGNSYWKLGEYQKAYEYFKASGLNIALANTVRLYNSHNIPLNAEEYVSLCETLISKNDHAGYVNLIAFYSGWTFDGIQDGKKALALAKEYYEKYSDELSANYLYAYCLERFPTDEDDLVLSNRLYRFLKRDPYGDYEHLYAYGLNDLGVQLLNGIGCEQNTYEAITYLRRAFIAGDKSAAKKLSELFKSDKEFKSELLSHFWDDKYHTFKEKKEIF